MLNSRYTISIALTEEEKNATERLSTKGNTRKKIFLAGIKALGENINEIKA